MKLGMLVYDHDLERHAKSSGSCLQGQGQSAGWNPKEITFFLISLTILCVVLKEELDIRERSSFSQIRSQIFIISLLNVFVCLIIITHIVLSATQSTLQLNYTHINY